MQLKVILGFHSVQRLHRRSGQYEEMPSSIQNSSYLWWNLRLETLRSSVLFFSRLCPSRSLLSIVCPIPFSPRSAPFVCLSCVSSIPLSPASIAILDLQTPCFSPSSVPFPSLQTHSRSLLLSFSLPHSHPCFLSRHIGALSPHHPLLSYPTFRASSEYSIIPSFFSVSLSLRLESCISLRLFSTLLTVLRVFFLPLLHLTPALSISLHFRSSFFPVSPLSHFCRLSHPVYNDD